MIKDWPEILKLETPPSDFCPISADWDKLGIPDMARMSLTKCYWMLQNSRVTTFTAFELPWEKQKGLKITAHPLSLQDILNQLCSSSIEAETTTHYIVHSHSYNPKPASIFIYYSTIRDKSLISFPLYGDDKIDDTKNWKKLMSRIRLIKDWQRFGEQLWWASVFNYNPYVTTWIMLRLSFLFLLYWIRFTLLLKRTSCKYVIFEFYVDHAQVKYIISRALVFEFNV